MKDKAQHSHHELSFIFDEDQGTGELCSPRSPQLIDFGENNEDMTQYFGHSSKARVEMTKNILSPSQLVSEDQPLQPLTKPTGLRRVKRFLNLEQRSGRLSSSRGTSPSQTISSSQNSDVRQFIMQQQVNSLKRHHARINSGQGYLHHGTSSNFDDSLGIESLKSDNNSRQM